MERVQREFAAARGDPEVLQRVKGFNIMPSRMSPSDFRANIAAETALWKKVIADNRLSQIE